MTDNHCDECLEWSQEEMEAYVKHRKLLVLRIKIKEGKIPFLSLHHSGSVSYTISTSFFDCDRH